MNMDVKDAVKRAKEYLSDLLAEEGLMNLGLEEIEYDDGQGLWLITLGFSRPWNATAGPLATIAGDTTARRTFRTLAVRDSDGEVLSVKKNAAMAID